MLSWNFLAVVTRSSGRGSRVDSGGRKKTCRPGSTENYGLTWLRPGRSFAAVLSCVYEGRIGVVFSRVGESDKSVSGGARRRRVLDSTPVVGSGGGGSPAVDDPGTRRRSRKRGGRMVGRCDQPRRHPVVHCEPLPSVSTRSPLIDRRRCTTSLPRCRWQPERRAQGGIAGRRQDAARSSARIRGCPSICS